MNRSQVKGRVKETKDKVKEVAGRTMDKELEVKVRARKDAGKVRAGMGDAETAEFVADIKFFAQRII